MGENDGLYLAAVNIFAAGDDHVLQAIQNIEIAICILVADVSCAKEAISERCCAIFAFVPIPAHYIFATHYQFAVLPRFHLFAEIVGYPQIYAGAWASAR